MDSDDEPEVNAWIGPKGTISSLHTDNKHNIFTQIKGEKLFKLISPKYSHKIQPISTQMFNSSRFEAENYTGTDIVVQTAHLKAGK